MYRYAYIAEIIHGQLEINQPVMLASLVDVQGSSPRHRGAKMVVTTDGKSYGTIGGSLLEYTVIREAKRVFIEQRPKFIDFDLCNDDADSTGMICGGKAVVLLDYIPASIENNELFQYWQKATANGDDFYFCTQITGNNNTGVSSHLLLFPDGKVLGNSHIPVSQLKGLVAKLHNIPATSVVSIGDTRVIVDPIRNVENLYCFGAGHVAIPTVHIAAMVGFRVVVIDDRTEFANSERFPEAAQICIVKSFNHALDGLNIEKDSFIIIMTRGHQFDRAVLEKALKTKAQYIGMISSRKKRNNIFQALLAKGVTKKELSRVYSPIGIDIGSETPEEIAVSIIAQLIKKRSRQKV